jgi:hypothetical protein
MMDLLRPETDGLLGRADDIYEALLNAHRGLDEGASAALNARLILLLAHLAGNPDAVLAAIEAAKGSAAA